MGNPDGLQYLLKGLRHDGVGEFSPSARHKEMGAPETGIIAQGSPDAPDEDLNPVLGPELHDHGTRVSLPEGTRHLNG